VKIYKEYIEKHPLLSNSEIADLILEQLDLNIKRKSILRGLQRSRSPKIVGSGKRGDSYQINEDEYEFKFGDYSFDVPKEHIAAACAWYVEPNGLTTIQVCQKLWAYFKRDIDEDFLSRIFRCLKINKSSNGLAPHILSEWDEEEVSEFFLKVKREKVASKLDDNTQYKQLYEEELKKSLDLEEFLIEIRGLIPEYDKPLIEYPKPTDTALDHDVVIILSDWHVGMKSKNFNKSIYARRLATLCAQIQYEFNTSLKKIRDIHILILGDMVDGPLANMRPEQAMAQDCHHEKQIILAARGIADVIDYVTPIAQGKVFMHGVGGNHGRFGEDRRDDPTRLADKMVYILAQEFALKTPEWVVHSNVVGDFMCRSTQVLFLHGDRGAKKTKDLVWAHRRDNAKKFVVCSGHFHTVKAEEAEKDIYTFRGGCLCGTDEYASSLGYGCRPAQMMFRVYDDGPRLPLYLPVDE